MEKWKVSRPYVSVSIGSSYACARVCGCAWVRMRGKIVFCFMLKYVITNLTLYDVAVHNTCTMALCKTTLDGAPRGQIVFLTVRCTSSARVCKCRHIRPAVRRVEIELRKHGGKKHLRDSSWNARFRRQTSICFVRKLFPLRRPLVYSYSIKLQWLNTNYKIIHLYSMNIIS